jgi:hypothetical protein
MIYFFINIPLSELAKLEDILPKGCYCLFQMQNASTRYYGIIRKDSYPLMMQTLTEESKKNVEILDKNIFQMFFLQNISDSITYVGNRKLMAYISDEY